MAGAYEPGDYWEERLRGDFSLKGVGHWEYDDAYNRWLYQAKADALNAALTGIGGRALDVGSGIGWVVGQLLDRDFAVDGCDIAEVAVERLGQEYPAAQFFQAAIGTDPLPRDDATFDVVTMLDVAYHITDDRLWASAIGDIARVLKPGGVLIVTDGMGAETVSPDAHVRFRSEGEWRRCVAAQGLVLSDPRVLYRRLSRPRGLRGWRRLPDGLRGQVEYRLDKLGLGRPNLRWAAIRKQV